MSQVSPKDLLSAHHEVERWQRWVNALKRDEKSTRDELHRIEGQLGDAHSRLTEAEMHLNAIERPRAVAK